ncbi:hypothetical protein F5J12DRAFT_383470 [Pisolithus orientalis]|uniref:uncharacterized protein n=1 Tax=Pisolithus orientalis TaxID=936130 RepID=UPI0022250403|nr:uncharacterized protein F5J12DRAFT_383470 [Pisolithus orientalis]KAI6028521.1 hypothetical protein F5J12DRAFT_383470 [Pisolithus orientalis]
MPSASLQSRIKAFEALTTTSSLSQAPTTAASTSFATPYKSRLGTTQSSESTATASGTFQTRVPLVASAPSSGSQSQSPTVCRRVSLIDLKDWVVEDGPFGGSLTSPQTGEAGNNQSINVCEPSLPLYSGIKDPPNDARDMSTPLIHLESPPKQRPPLPPRKPSYLSAGASPVPRVLSIEGNSGATLRPPCSSDSLTIEHTYPPQTFGTARLRHAPASSISSFHSVSLSSEGSGLETPDLGTLPQNARNVIDNDSASIADSFEDVSVTSVVDLSTAVTSNWMTSMEAPKITPEADALRTKVVPLPPKPPIRPVSATSPSTLTTLKTRRPPPPPPPYAPRFRIPASRTSLTPHSGSTSDRSSILSTTSTTSRTSTHSNTARENAMHSQLHRPTPVPASARARYETLFVSALLGQRQIEKQSRRRFLPCKPISQKERQAAGWRGLSLDLLAQQEDHTILSPDSRESELASDSDSNCAPVSAEEKLNGRIVKYIWKASRLDRRKLWDIWNECDPQKTGSLDRNAFIQGMWRIDEELRRAQLARCTSALSVASSQRIPHRPLPRSSTPLRLVS